MKRGKATVVWELLDSGGAQRLVVDVDAPLRPFGADPTPPHGIPFDGAADDHALAHDQPHDETLDDLVLPGGPSQRAVATEALLKALRASSRRE